MHVLIPVLHRPNKPTGVCRHAVNLADCFADNDCISRITLIIGRWQQIYFRRSFNLESPKIQLITVDIKNSSLARNRWFVFGLPELAQQLQPDIVHMSFPIPFFRGWFKTPVVSTIHDLYPYECPENFGYPQVWFNRWFLAQCVRNSDGISCVSQVTLNSLSQFFPEQRFHQKRAVIYNYVDFKKKDVEVPPLLVTKDIQEFILCVAQHRKNKNIDLLIQAYAQLFREGILRETMKLILVGSAGPETEHLNKLIESLSLQSQVIFLSSLADKELCWLYKKASLFVIPSSAEGFCLPLVEALFWGCKVVCSNIPIFQEVGSNTCTYFQLGDDSIINLTSAMVQTLNAEPSTFSSIKPDFLKKNVSQKLIDFYRSLDSLCEQTDISF